MAGRALPGPVGYEQIPALAERGRARIGHFLDALEQQLATNEFVAGAAFSVADITAVVTVDFARAVKVRPDEQRHPHLLRWRERMGERPSMAA
jgi:glutathione S-transferase